MILASDYQFVTPSAPLGALTDVGGTLQMHDAWCRCLHELSKCMVHIHMSGYEELLTEGTRTLA